MKKDLNKIIDVFKVQCRCVYQKRGGKEEIVYEDEIIIVDNFDMALTRFNYMVAKCNALGYYAKHDYWIKIRKCEIMDNGLLDCGEVILQHLKGEKEFDRRRIVLKIKPDLGIWAIYDNKEERFLEETKPFYAFDTEWKGWETIINNVEFQRMNNKEEEK